MNRVAYVCADPGIPPDGSKGAAVHFRSLATAFARLDIPLDVFVARAGAVDGFVPHRASVVATPSGKGRSGELLQLGHNAALLGTLQAAGPHCAVYERLSLFGLAGLAHARTLGVPFVVEVNAPLWREAAQFRALSIANTARGVCLDVLQQADRVLAVSSALADELVAAGVPSASITVLGNGADVVAFRTARPAPKPLALRGRPTLLFVGSLKAWHGIEFLVRAFAALRAQVPCGLWIVGDGPERGTIHQAIAAFPDDIVHEGAVDHDRIPALLQAADLVVAPYSRAAPAYFSPLKLVEALAAGRPVLASRVPCVLDTLGHQRPLGLFAADDVVDFVVAAQRVLAAGPTAAHVGIDPEAIAALDWSKKAATIAPWLGLQPRATLLEVERG